MVGQCLISMPRYAMQCVRKPQRFKDLPSSLKISSTKRVWLNVVGAIKTAGVRILRIFVRTLQTKLPPLDTFFHSRFEYPRYSGCGRRLAILEGLTRYGGA